MNGDQVTSSNPQDPVVVDESIERLNLDGVLAQLAQIAEHHQVEVQLTFVPVTTVTEDDEVTP
jgi:hypothetical protein